MTKPDGKPASHCEVALLKSCTSVAGVLLIVANCVCVWCLLIFEIRVSK